MKTRNEDDFGLVRPPNDGTHRPGKVVRSRFDLGNCVTLSQSAALLSTREVEGVE